MRFKLFILFFITSLVLCFNNFKANATHLMGGDIVYKCLGNNRFEFTLTLFQDCLDGQNGAIADDNPAYYAIFLNNNSNNLVAKGSAGMPISQQVVPTGFSNNCINNYPNTCMLKTVFKFERTLPPTNVGYVFTYQRCCRNQSINNIYNPGNTGVTYSIIIPPFTNGVCPNNSPTFNTNPPQIICVNNPMNFDFSSTDIDGDSLSYELCSAYIGGDNQNSAPGNPQGNAEIQAPPYMTVSYVPPYNDTFPLPSNPRIRIDPVTGIMTGTPTTAGRYIVSVCVTEWRSGIAINHYNRDLQFVVTNCSKAVVANIPSKTHEADVYVALCDSSFTVNFENSSTGGFAYSWDFGDPTTTSDVSTQQFPSYTYPDTGTYIVKLVVNPGSTCPDSIEKKVKIYPKFEVDFDIVGKLCRGEVINFNDKSVATFPHIFGWEWSFGDGKYSNNQNTSHIYTDNREEYWVKLIAKTTKGCIDTASYKVFIPYVKPFAGNDTTVIVNEMFTMNGSGGTTYQWTPSTYLTDPTNPNTSAIIPEIGVYKYGLHVVKGVCEGSDTVKVTVADGPYFKVPTAFSPNGDGKNDVIRPLTAGFKSIQYFKIYNRWGQLVFQMYNSNTGGWDGTLKGKEAPSDVYFWYAQGVGADGEIKKFKGDITLIR